MNEIVIIGIVIKTISPRDDDIVSECIIRFLPRCVNQDIHYLNIKRHTEIMHKECPDI